MEGVFKGVSDRFNGVTIDSTSESCDAAQFDGVLESKYTACDLIMTTLTLCANFIFIFRIPAVLDGRETARDLVSRAPRPGELVASVS